ncbi:CDP-alcohol phosphatidyltransferase family protein [Sphingomonas abietis]|uniref:CDP-alcohol phosphatidyltransferase family protein n=1 Tax=Sphingomonas abietis TaxID=3012344 RepID=A0ABY7NLN2_9SPHN|nr:CDP-alcohol phosphatidyltransferase family protein [Sphingomonas abietis]WBO22263.1 CDP-alcohol phosphatidyltransferase family protein [Sphingomonas abietis]
MEVKDHQGVAFLGAGDNDTRVFGLIPAERARRLATKAKLRPIEQVPATGDVIVADLGFTWDPAWLAHVRDHGGLAVTYRGRPVLVHCTDADQVRAVIAAIGTGAPLPAGFDVQDAETDASLYNATLRKREDAYLVPLVPAAVRGIEKASYDASYKGVTDILTLYLWRGVAFRLTRWAAYARITPNMVTIVGIALCVWAFFLFWGGHFAAGLLVGLIFMVLDTVDGKLARCTGTSSEWGNILDHGVDLVHPPFWYWAWGMGCAVPAWGLAFDTGEFWAIMVVLVAGYAMQRTIEGAFITSFGIHIHVWERIDSRFRLVTARRNPNYILLLASLIVLRPDWGLWWVAWWTMLSCLFHLVRLVQAYAARAQGREIMSWLV